MSAVKKMMLYICPLPRGRTVCTVLRSGPARAEQSMSDLSPARAFPPTLALSLSSLFWAGNFIVGRALRDEAMAVELNYWRWLLAASILLPFMSSVQRNQGRRVFAPDAAVRRPVVSGVAERRNPLVPPARCVVHWRRYCIDRSQAGSDAIRRQEDGELFLWSQQK